jgi:hypothetical protein
MRATPKARTSRPASRPWHWVIAGLVIAVADLALVRPGRLAPSHAGSHPRHEPRDAQAVRAYRILGVPTTVFITPARRILKRHVGLLSRDQMHALVAELLRAPASP